MKNLSLYAGRCRHFGFQFRSSILFNSQSLAFCTKTATEVKDAQSTTAETTDSSVTSETSSETSSDAKSTEPSSASSSSSSVKTENRPLVHIHDEERPQLSIQLPKRWPFTRLARKPVAPAEPLNMHQMTTFSGLPAANFMPTEADKAKAEARRLAEKKKTKEEKRREARIHFWKRYTIILLCTPLLLFVWDNRKAKQLAQKRASYVSSCTADDARSIRDLATLNNAEIMDLYKWILFEECDNDMGGALSVDKFGSLVVRAVNTFKQRKQLDDGVPAPDSNKPKQIRLSREYDAELTARDKKREVKWLMKKFERVRDRRLACKASELQPWDLNVFFTEYNLASSDRIPLKTLFTALSHVTSETLYHKAEVAFRVHGEHIDEAMPSINYHQLTTLVDDMVITGHFTTNSLVIRRAYFPSQFGVRTSEEICDVIFASAGVDKGADGTGVITFEQFGEALMTLAEGRRMMHKMVGFFLPLDFKPWCQAWYCSLHSKNEINEEKRSEEYKQKREERKRKKVEKQNAQNINVDSNEPSEDDDQHYDSDSQADDAKPKTM